MVSRPTRTVQIVLAAGRSERMGSSKPLLDFGGRTALRLALDAAAGAGVLESVVVVGKSAPEVMAAHAAKQLPLGVRWVKNDEEGSEQLRSLQLGLAACRGEGFDGFFIHPVDHPLATPADYGLLLKAFSAVHEGGERGASGASDASASVFILSHGGRRGHPILCRWPVAEMLLSLGPPATARDVIEKERIAYVVTPNAGVREDMDTPEEYGRVLAIFLSGARKN